MMEENLSFRRWRISATAQSNLAQAIAVLSCIRRVRVASIC